MADTFSERRDHILYATWFGLALIILTLAITYRMDTLVHPIARMTGLGPSAGGTVSTGLAIACGGYLIFRLIRPFGFAVTDVPPTQNVLYWVGTLVVTLSTVLIAAFLGWAAVFSSLFPSIRVIGLTLSISLVIGFLFIEASVGRSKEDAKSYSPLYADAGVLSAVIMAPAILAWYVFSSRQSGLSRLIMGTIRDYSAVFVGLCVTAVVFLVWLSTMSLRKRRRRSRLYRAAIDALWVFGIAGFLFVAVTLPYMYAHFRGSPESGPGPIEQLHYLAFGRPLMTVGIVTVIWIVATRMLYSHRANEEQR